MADRPMSILQHLGELRRRLIIAALAAIAGAAVAYSQVNLLRGLLHYTAEGLELIYLTPPEVLMTDIKLSFIAGILITSPIILYQVWGFVLPALKSKERRIILPLVFASVFFFLMGVMFCYFVVLPFVIRFFLGFQAPGLSPLFSYSRYVSFIMTLLLAFGTIFQMPLILLFLTRAGIVSTAGLRRSRRLAYLLMLVGSAVFTPPDVVSQLLMSGPLALLYEFSILISWFMTRRRPPAV